MGVVVYLMKKCKKDMSPSLNEIWRSIVLRGANVASYKFALAESLIELANVGKTFVTIEDLSVPFSGAICRHIKDAEKQITSSTPGKFLNACMDYNQGLIDKDRLLHITTKHAFDDVIDRFHTVNRTQMPKSFYIDDRNTKNGLTLTDELLMLQEGFQFQNLPNELEARWRLVETAWELKISHHLLEVEYDDSTFNTGSLSTLDSDDIDDVVVYMKGVRPEYKEKSKVKFRVYGRERFPTRTYSTSSQNLTVKFIPSHSQYSVRDALSEDEIIPFSTGSYLSCDGTSNYFRLDLNAFQPERHYRFLYKVVSGSGNTRVEHILDEDHIFKVTR